MALDPLRSIAVNPALTKAAKTASASSPNAATSFEAALASGSAPGVSSGLGSSSDHGSNKSGVSTHSSGASHDSGAKASGKESTPRPASSTTKSRSNTRSKPGTSRSQNGATAEAVGTAAAIGAKAPGGANPQGHPPPASSTEVPEQSQAEPAQSTAAAAPPAAAATTAIAASFAATPAAVAAVAATAIEEPADANADADTVTALPNGKPKTSTDKDSDAAVDFISQSLAAAMAGVRQPIPAQAIPTTSSEDTDSDTVTDATAVVSLSTGSSAALQKLVTTLANDAADTLKAAVDPNSATRGSKSDTPANGVSAGDGSNAAISAFQAQMSISSHFQQPPTPDSSPNEIRAPVGSPAFNDELGGKITWLASQGIQSASVQLSPEHLGPMSVHISVQAGLASVSFNAAHADTRAALEQALPRLREMFATNGLTLSDANVSHQSPRDQAPKQSINAIGRVRGAAADETTSSTVTSVSVGRLGLVDTYA